MLLSQIENGFMEPVFLYASYLLYTLYFIICLTGVLFLQRNKTTGEWILGFSPFLLFSGIGFLGLSILLRWIRLKHGPYLGLYEGLLSGLWISGVFYAHLITARKDLRKTGMVGGFFLVLWSTWLLIADKGDTVLPAVYGTWWIVIHILFGKFSYGALFPIFVIALYHLMSTLQRRGEINDTRDFEKLSYRYMTIVFTFATAMMIGGGIWAQMAWGREWSWGTLEIWSLVLWLIYGLYIHLRLTYYNAFKRSWSFYVIFAYALTFYNLFGIPFLSRTIHRGVL